MHCGVFSSIPDLDSPRAGNTPAPPETSQPRTSPDTAFKEAKLTPASWAFPTSFPPPETLKWVLELQDGFLAGGLLREATSHGPFPSQLSFRT